MSKSAADAIRTSTKRRTSTMKKLRAIADILAVNCSDGKAKDALKGLASKFKYSDPVSPDSVIEIDEEMETKLSECSVALDSNDYDLVLKKCKEVSMLLEKRNRFALLGK